MHTSISKKKDHCEKVTDRFGDYAVICGMGAHIFTRHTALNNVLLQVGRAVGYVALEEQVIPEMLQSQKDSKGGVRWKEARVDVELFGHPTAPDRLLDGTIRHPVTVNVVKKAATEPGFAAEQGSKDKLKRYPPAHGKSVVGCAIETWGRLGDSIDDVLVDLHGLAQRKQRDKGISPTNWILRSLTHKPCASPALWQNSKLHARLITR